MAKTIRIKGGTIQTPTESIEADIIVKGDRISALVARDDETPASEVIDATGKWILPGLIDMHAHTRVPGYEAKEDYFTASQAAANGGYTTFVDMPNVEPPTTTVDLLKQKRAIAEEQSIIDWGHFAGATELDQIEGLAAEGVSGFKIFQVTGGYPHDPRLAIDDPAKLYATFRAIAETGLLCVVHPFTQSLFEYLYEQELAKGRLPDIHTFSDVYTRDVVWRTAVAVLVELQRETGVRLQVVHTHAAGSLRLLRSAKQDGLAISVAVDPKYIHLRDEDIQTQGARAIPGGAVTNDADRMKEMWRSFEDGTIDVVDSDHAPHTLDDLKSMDVDPLMGAFGAPHYDHMLSVMLTDVHNGKLRLGRLVAALTENPAKLLGIYPNKGAIQPGSLADIVVVDPEKEVIPSDDEMYSKSAWTPYTGWHLIGGPVLTMLRGEVIARDGDVIGKAGFGEYIGNQPLEPVSPPPGVSPSLSLAPKG
jgi:dihydroorotase (multifunctional complex type)